MVTSTEKDTFVYLSSGYSFPILPPSPVTKNNPSDDLTCVSQPINMIASWPVKKQMFLMLSMTGGCCNLVELRGQYLLKKHKHA